MSMHETTDIRTRNPFEIALWVSAAIMLVLGLAMLFVTSATVEMSMTCSDTSCAALSIVHQLSYSLVLPLLLGFIITAGIALGTRALEWNARHRATESVAPDLAEVVSQETSAVGVQSPGQPAAETTRPGTATKPDHRLFMRPTD
jgi:hypothetical protein